MRDTNPSRSSTHLGKQVRQVSEVTGFPIEVVDKVIKEYLKVLIVGFVRTGKLNIKNLVTGSFKEFKERGAVKASQRAERPYMRCSTAVKDLRRRFIAGDIDNLNVSNLDKYHNRYSSQAFSRKVANNQATDGEVRRSIERQLDQEAREIVDSIFEQSF